MTRPHSSTLVRLVAEAEAARLVLERLVNLGIQGEELRKAVTNRASALEQLSQHLRPVNDFAFFPEADRTRGKNRKPKTESDSAA